MSLKIDEKEFKLKFFEEMGFKRKQCPKCGSWFWTLNNEQIYCNDAPCIEYSFFDLNYKTVTLDVRGSRNKFINFFKRHGHTPIKPKPVVARWREDLYLTIASIVDFQPFVTDGVVPPPANPLVISQPCIRLEDIDNVGKTAGRHLTSFEMAAHHAFNYPDRFIYWKDETVNYAYKFFTEDIGVKPEDLTFKESWWEGGGNAGPCFEVTVGGLEVATLVFMQYKVVNGDYVPIPLKVVDTGYGIERITWLSQRAITGFHAIYGGLAKKFFNTIGVEEPPEDILAISSRLASTVEPESRESLELYYRNVAKRAGRKYEEVKKILTTSERVFAVLDHTKTIALMLADGIVPSNTGEGYLARLVIRRALRALAKLGSPATLSELVRYQVSFWGEDFPRLKRRADYIFDAVNLEEERFRKTLKKGLNYVERLIKKKGKKLILEDLIELYDSHGIPPDIVEEVATKKNVKISVPENFFSIVAKRHARAEIKEEKPAIPEDIAEDAKKLPPTKLLFHENVYLKEFKGKVVYSKPGFLVLDQTAFYAEGGGQLSDIGLIKWNNNKTKVIHVFKVGDVIIHKLKEPVVIPMGSYVKGKVDWSRRLILMQHHTSTHIILGAARRVLGEHVWQAGAEKRPDKARLDITHHKPLTKEEIRKIEMLANNVVLEGRKVIARFMDRTEAEAKYGLTLYQGGVPPGRIIRIVEIEDWDVEACFGTHVTNTREVGVIKIVNVDRIQDGVIRLEYTSAIKALEHMWKLEDTLENIASKVNASVKDVELRIRKLMKEYERTKRELAALKREWIISEAEKLLATKVKKSWGYLISGFYKGKSDDDLLEVSKKVLSKLPSSAIVLYNLIDDKLTFIVLVGEKAIEKRALASNIAKMILEKIVEGKGGGREDYAAGSGKPLISLDKIVKETLKTI